MRAADDRFRAASRSPRGSPDYARSSRTAVAASWRSTGGSIADELASAVREPPLHGPAGEFVCRTHRTQSQTPMALLVQFLGCFGAAARATSLHGGGDPLPVRARLGLKDASILAASRPLNLGPGDAVPVYSLAMAHGLGPFRLIIRQLLDFSASWSDWAALWSEEPVGHVTCVLPRCVEHSCGLL